LSSEQQEGAGMGKQPWFMFDIVVPFGVAGFDVQLGGAHDIDIGAPPNYEVTALLPGTISSITDGIDAKTGTFKWGRQVGVELDEHFNGIRFMAYLHLSGVNPHLAENQPISKGDLIGWVGGGFKPSMYGDTTNPTGVNFLNTKDQSSQIQVGVALMRGREYGNTAFNQWPPVETELDPTQIILDARKAFLGGEDMLQITDPFAAAFFTQIAEDRWRCVKTNKDVFGGILIFYRRIGGAPRLPLTGEQNDIPEVTYQVFEAGVIVFDPHHKLLDHPPGFEPSYLLRLDSDLAKRLLH